MPRVLNYLKAITPPPSGGRGGAVSGGGFDHGTHEEDGPGTWEALTPLLDLSRLRGEPVTSTSGTYQGTTVLQDEQNKGLALINALDAAQRQQAILAGAKTGDHNVGEAFKDSVALASAGIRATELTAAQQAQLLDLIGAYVRNLRDGHAQVKMDEVRRHLDETHFAWIGETGPTSVFYYRIHSSVVLIEFDHQTPIALPRLERGSRPASISTPWYGRRTGTIMGRICSGSTTSSIRTRIRTDTHCRGTDLPGRH